jgi:hypothetical protein
VLEHLVEEMVGGEPLALQSALHVADGQQHGVDPAGLDLAPQRIDGQQSSHRHGALPTHPAPPHSPRKYELFRQVVR